MNHPSSFLSSVLLCMLCAAPAAGQGTQVDSLLRRLDAVKSDSARVSLLISLSTAYRQVDQRKALDAADSALTLARATGIPVLTGRAHLNSGSLLRAVKTGDYGLSHLRLAEEEFRRAGDSIGLGESYLQRGRVGYTTGDTEAALEIFQAARSLFRNLAASGNPAIAGAAVEGIHDSYHYAWITYYFAGRHREGLDLLFEFERKVLLPAGESPQLCNCYNNIAITYRSLGEREKSLEYFGRGLEIARRIDSWDDQQRILINMSYEYVTAGDFPKGRELLLEALALQSAAKGYLNPGSLPHIYSDLADIETRMGRYAPALEYYLQALKLFENAGNPHELADLEISMSDFFYLQADYPEANHYLNRAKANFEQVKNPLGISQVLDRLGKIAADRGRFEEALGYHRESITHRASGGDKLANGLTYYEMGNVFLRMAERDERYGFEGSSTSVVPPEAANRFLDSAARYFTMALQIRGGMNDGQTSARCFYGLGRVESLRDDLVRASGYFDRSRHLSDSLGMKRELYESYEALAEAAAAGGRPEEAYRYHRRYAEVKDSVFNENSEKQLRESQARYETEKKDRDIELLNRQREISELKVREQGLALDHERLESQKKEGDILLLNQAKQLQDQELLASNRALRERELEAKSAAAQLELLRKDQLLKEQQLEENRVLMYGSLVIAGLTLALGSVLYSRFRLRRELEKREAVLEERRRIGSEMHDDLGSSLSTIALLSEVAKKRLDGSAALGDLERVSNAVQHCLESMSDIVWSLNPRNDRLENLVAHIRRHAVEYLENTPIRATVAVEGEVPDRVVSGEQRRNVFLAVKEALHNVVKHSGATEAAIRFGFGPRAMSLSVHDNGKGIDPEPGGASGNGLANMRRRLADAGGDARIENREGTTVTFTLPLT